MRLVGDDELKPFEQQTLDISRRTYRLTVVAALIAFGAAIFVGVQVEEMTNQTQILASQTESASAGSLMDGMNTRKQLAIAQQEVDVLTKQLTYNQRLTESQRASIDVAFLAVLNPVSFHEEGQLSEAFSIIFKNNRQFPATNIAVRYRPYFIQWGPAIFTEPKKRQSELCNKPLSAADKASGNTPITIYSGGTKEWQINFGMGKPLDADVIEWPPNQPKQTKRLLPIVVGCVDYQSGVMPERHQTGFIFEIERGNPNMPALITLGEDVPRNDVLVTQYFFGQGKIY